MAESSPRPIRVSHPSLPPFFLAAVDWASPGSRRGPSPSPSPFPIFRGHRHAGPARQHRHLPQPPPIFSRIRAVRHTDSVSRRLSDPSPSRLPLYAYLYPRLLLNLPRRAHYSHRQAARSRARNAAGHRRRSPSRLAKVDHPNPPLCTPYSSRTRARLLDTFWRSLPRSNANATVTWI